MLLCIPNRQKKKALSHIANTVILYSIEAVVIIGFAILNVSLYVLCSAYTEPFPMNPVSAGLSADEDHGRTSEEEDGTLEQSYDRQVSGKIQKNRCIIDMGSVTSYFTSTRERTILYMLKNMYYSCVFKEEGLH